MPLYEYECANCHHRFEKIESYSAPEKQKCPKCGKVAHRVLAAPAIQFKGSGWYVTDYGGKAASSTSSSKPNGGASSHGETSAAKAGSGKSTSDKAGAGKKD